jgi:hypothetical protein
MATNKTASRRLADTKQADEPLFYTSNEDGTPIYVDLEDGRRAIVGEEPRALPRSMWKAAARAGCMSTQMARNVRSRVGFDDSQVHEADDPVKRQKLIIDAIYGAVQADADAPGYETAFTSNGLPNVDWLCSNLGFKLTADERDAAWVEVQRMVERDDAAENEATAAAADID